MRPLESTLQIGLDPLAEFRMVIEKITDPAQGRIKLNPLPLEFKLGETELGHPLPHPLVPPNRCRIRMLL